MTWNEIAEHYGWAIQAEKAIEEMAELTKEICKYNKALRRKNPLAQEGIWHCLVDELADVGVMVEQITYLLRAEQAVNQMREEKLARQNRRILQEGGEAGGCSGLSKTEKSDVHGE